MTSTKKTKTVTPKETKVTVTPKETKVASKEKVVNEVTKEEKKVTKIKHILYAVNSSNFDKSIFEEAEKKNTKVTVLVLNKYSRASINKYLKSRDLRLITVFSAKFDKEKFDVGFIEKEMVEYIPKRIIKELNKK